MKVDVSVSTVIRAQHLAELEHIDRAVAKLYSAGCHEIKPLDISTADFRDDITIRMRGE